MLAGSHAEVESPKVKGRFRKVIVGLTVGVIGSLLLVVVSLGLLASTTYIGRSIISKCVFGTPPNPPLCHKQLMVPMHSYCDEHPDRTLPNVNGESEASFTLLTTYLGLGSAKFASEWLPKYKYVPGLTQDDPGELIVLYLSKPTRWKVHILEPAAWESEGWIVCPLDEFAFQGLSRTRSTCVGEMSEKLTAEQFRERLQRTLDYLKANHRPYWEVVVKGHQATLDSLTFTVPKARGANDPSLSAE